MEVYKQKEYDLRNLIDNTLSLPSTFEEYTQETESFINRLIEETKEFNIIKSKNKRLEDKIQRLQEENEDLKRDNGFYQDCMNIIKAVLHKSGFICQEVTNDEVENCDAEFVITRRNDGTITISKQMESEGTSIVTLTEE